MPLYAKIFEAFEFPTTLNILQKPCVSQEIGSIFIVYVAIHISVGLHGSFPPSFHRFECLGVQFQGWT